MVGEGEPISPEGEVREVDDDEGEVETWKRNERASRRVSSVRTTATKSEVDKPTIPQVGGVKLDPVLLHRSKLVEGESWRTKVRRGGKRSDLNRGSDSTRLGELSLHAKYNEDSKRK